MAGANFGFAGIATEKLTEENYENWKECLKSYFIAQGLWGVVNGDEKKPADPFSSDYEAWNRKNAMALHAIQISCAKDTMSKLRGNESAKYEWDLLVEKKREPTPNGTCIINEERSDICSFRTVYEAVENGDWEDIRLFLRKPGAVRAGITSNNDTVLHVAVMAKQTVIVKKLMSSESGTDLELKNKMGYTAFFIAAINGNLEMVEVMLEKDANLVNIKDDHGLIPLVAASFYGARNMVHYLYRQTPHEILSPENPDRNGATLLNCLISDELYDLALHLLKKYPHLGFVEDLHRNYAIRLLSHKRSAFPSGNKFVFWKQWIYSVINVTYKPDDEDSPSGDEENIIRTNPKQKIGIRVLNALHWVLWKFLTCCVPDIDHIYEKKLKHAQALEILKCMFEHIPYLLEEQLVKIKWDEALHDAIKKGITEFICEAMKATPEIIWRKDKRGRTIFAHAIVERQENIFNHVYDLGEKMRITVIRHDIFGNNFLHLAAKLSPQSRLDQISGAALQMQRELEWFEEVKRILPPKYGEEVNENNKTPSELFTEEHKELRKEGESWMKNTAASCMVVATLIAAVMFTSAFTVPGGNDEKTGIPNFLKHNGLQYQIAFLIFAISNALSLFSSCTSVLVFLGILTSRYAEKDFRKFLPMKLIVGLFTLFFSIVTMMVCFGAGIFLILEHKLHWASVPIITLSTIPVALYAFFQFPLLVEILICTFGRGIFNNSKSMKKES